MKTIAFFGGSNLIGAGYPDGIIDKNIYPNVVASNGYKIRNYGIAGASNTEIFLSCLHQLTVDPPDIIFIEWNRYARHRFWPAPDTSINFTASNVTLPLSWDHCTPISKSKLDHFQEVLTLLDGEYYRILTLLKYCGIIQNFCNLKGVNLVMCNSSIPWDIDLFKDYQDATDLSNSLSQYSKELLDFENRSDNNIIQLISKLKYYFDQINIEYWVFIFDSINKLTIDRAPLDLHPGPKTMKIVADRIIAFLKEKNL